MLYCEARSAARRTAAGGFVPLSEQDPAAVVAGDDRRGRAGRSRPRGRRGSSAASSWRRRSSPCTSSAASPGAPTGRRWPCSTTGWPGSRPPSASWSAGPPPSAKQRGRATALPRWARSRATQSAATSPIGRSGPTSSRGWATPPRPRPTRPLSVSPRIRRSRRSCWLGRRLAAIARATTRVISLKSQGSGPSAPGGLRYCANMTCRATV